MKRILLDMDGVLCDFDARLNSVGKKKENGKADWDALRKFGPKFWSEMDWLPEGKKLYDKLVEFQKSHDVELGILSAIFMSVGKNGKKSWVKKNCPEIKEENIIIIRKSDDKCWELKENDILIDDRKSIIESVDIIPGAAGILFENADQVMEVLENLFK